MEAAFSAGNFLGSLSSSYLIMAVGNVFVLLIIAVLNVIAYVFTNICLPESLPGALKVSKHSTQSKLCLYWRGRSLKFGGGHSGFS